VPTAVCQVVDSGGQIVSLTQGKCGTPLKVEGWNGVLSDISCAAETFCVAVDWEGIPFTGP
jgi:hypothetical protein